MAKSYGTRKKSSFAQKKKNLREMEELEESGLLDLLSNRQRPVSYTHLTLPTICSV